MIKELLIAGLMSSVASTDNHLTTHYQNNTQYEQLRCGEICVDNNIRGTHVSYRQYEYNNMYEPMEEFLDKYKFNVIDSLDQIHDDIRSTRYNFEHLVDNLRQDVFEHIHSSALTKYVSFHITNDGVLTFSKPFELK